MRDGGGDRRRWIAAATVGAILLLGGAGGQAQGVRSPPSPAPALAGVFRRGTLRAGGRQRTFGFYAPASLPPRAPLVVALHGSGESGADFRAHTAYAFDRLADSQGFAVAYPDGFERHWDDCRRAARYSARGQRIDDVAFVEALVGYLRSALRIDPARVFAVGHSNGGQMAYRLALESPNIVRAVAVISAGLPTPDNLDCRPAGKAISILIMNGTADPLNPYAGGPVSIFGFGARGEVRSSLASARYFSALAGLSAAPTAQRLPGGTDDLWVERTTWSAPGRAEVVLDTIHGGGHVVPQPFVTYPDWLGPTARFFDGPREIWRFFQGQ